MINIWQRLRLRMLCKNLSGILRKDDVMQIGEVIRKYRKEKGMTQEEMANRLGVTAPAVNKWENGNSMPDIMLLAPIARLLEVSLDTLLSYQEELTNDEVVKYVMELDELLKTVEYEEAFQWAKKKIEIYPNCLWLIWQMMVILDAQRLVREVPDAEKYDAYIVSNFERVLQNGDEKLKTNAADSLFSYYVRKEQYEKAEEYLKYFSNENPERKRKQALIYSKTGRREDAYKAYEEVLFSSYGTLSLVLNGIYLLAMEDKDLEKAEQMIDKQKEMAKAFEMGRYHEVSCELEFATVKEDRKKVLWIVEEMLKSLDDIAGFRKSSLYEHMEFKEVREEFAEDLKEKLLKGFRDEETFGFMQDEENWNKIVGA